MKKFFKKGFTLVELLVVIAIIAILGTVSVVGYIGFTEDAKVSNDFTELTEYKTVAEAKLFDGSEIVEYSAAVVGDDVSGKYVVKSDGGITAKLNNTDTKFALTSDETAKSGVTYYSLSDTNGSGTATAERIVKVDTAAVYKEFAYSVSGNSKSIAVYYGSYVETNGDSKWTRTDTAVTEDDTLILLVNLLSNATGETVNKGYFYVHVTEGDGSTKPTSLDYVGYHHNASLKQNNAGSDIKTYEGCKVLWTISSSTVAKI